MEFSELVKNHNKKIKNIIKRNIKYKIHDREDVYQEIIIKILRNISSFKKNSNINTWIHTICMNEIKNYFKREENSFNFISIESLNQNNLPDVLKDFNTPLSELEQKEFFNTCFDDLNQKEIDIYDMKYNKGMTAKEIGQHLNKPIGTILSIIHTLKKKIIKKRNINYVKTDVRRDNKKSTTTC